MVNPVIDRMQSAGALHSCMQRIILTVECHRNFKRQIARLREPSRGALSGQPRRRVRRHPHRSRPRRQPAVTAVLRRLPQRQAEDRRSGSRSGEARRSLRTTPRLGSGPFSQLRAKSMPPVPMPRPDAATYDKVASLSGNRARPRRCRQAESRRSAQSASSDAHRIFATPSAILLAVDDLPKEMDFTLLLPADNAASGFDNIADLLYVSPATMERYLDAATKISRLAVGDPQMPLMVNIHRLPLEGASGFAGRGSALRNARRHRDSQLLPAGWRIRHSMWNWRARRAITHQLEVSIDGERKELVTLGGAARRRARRAADAVDAAARAPRISAFAVKAGPRTDRRHVRAEDRSFGRSHAAARAGAAAERSRRLPRSPFADRISDRSGRHAQPASGFSPATRPTRPRKRPAPSRSCPRWRGGRIAVRSTDADVATLLAFYDNGPQGAEFRSRNPDALWNACW